MYIGTLKTDRNKETACPIRTVEKVREKLQPCVIAIHDQLAFSIIELLCFDLRKPRVLSRKRRGRVRLGEVENHVHKGRDRARCDGFDAGHGNGGGRCVSGKGKRGAVSNEAR